MTLAKVAAILCGALIGLATGITIIVIARPLPTFAHYLIGYALTRDTS